MKFREVNSPLASKPDTLTSGSISEAELKRDNRESRLISPEGGLPIVTWPTGNTRYVRPGKIPERFPIGRPINFPVNYSVDRVVD